LAINGTVADPDIWEKGHGVMVTVSGKAKNRHGKLLFTVTVLEK
jgi:hypothetical protein